MSQNLQTAEKFLFELTDKTVGEVVIGEVIFVPQWETKYNFTTCRNRFEKESYDYQSACKHLISKCGYVVVRIIEHGIVLFPVAKLRIDKKILLGLDSTVISTGKIVKQY